MGNSPEMVRAYSMNDAIDRKNLPKRRKIMKDSPRMRPLVQREPKPVKKSHKRKIIAGILLTTIICLLTAFVWQNEEFRVHIKRLAMNQFQLYLHGRENYCDEPFEHWHISNKLHHRIVGQDAALSEIDLALQQHNNITALALVGTQGVGKTLAVNLIQGQFQWHLNIQQYIWSLIESPYMQLMHLLKLLNGLTTCGQNGLFIDGIPLKSVHIIDEFHQKLLAYCRENHIKLIVVYVVQIRVTSDANADALMHFNKVKMINFRQFNADDLRNCINMECERLNITIKPQQINEMLNDIDPKRNGCKLIASKLARQPTDEDL